RLPGRDGRGRRRRRRHGRAPGREPVACPEHRRGRGRRRRHTGPPARGRARTPPRRRARPRREALGAHEQHLPRRAPRRRRQGPAGEPVRAALRRGVFLLAGGAVAVALLLLATPLSALLPGGPVVNALLFLPVWLALAAALGLLPGVREIEVAGARDLLDVGEDEVVTPEPLRWEHRWRTALWVLCHQVVGLVTGLALTAAALLLLVSALVAGGRREVSVAELSVDLAGGTSGIGLAIGCVVTAGLVVAVAVGLGRAAAWSAPLLLGPTGGDRLAIAEARLARGRAHLRLSQDLHDGVGHSLSAISLQAAAAERGLAADAGPTREALGTIRSLAAEAVGELEQVLAILRDDADGHTRLEEHRDARDLPDVVAAHRQRGAEVDLVLPGEVPDLQIGRASCRESVKSPVGAGSMTETE